MHTSPELASARRACAVLRKGKVESDRALEVQRKHASAIAKKVIPKLKAAKDRSAEAASLYATLRFNANEVAGELRTMSSGAHTDGNYHLAEKLWRLAHKLQPHW